MELMHPTDLKAGIKTEIHSAGIQMCILQQGSTSTENF